MKTIPSAIASEIASRTCVPRRLLTIMLDSGAIRYTDHTSNIVYGGNTYTARRFTHSPIKTFFANKTDNTTIQVDNVDQAMSAYYAYNKFSGRKANIQKVFLKKTTALVNGAITNSVTTINYDNLVNTFPSSGSASVNGEDFTFSGNTGTALTGCSARRNASPDNSVLFGWYPIDGYLQFTGYMDTIKSGESYFEFRIVNAFDRSSASSPWRRFDRMCNWDFCSAGYCTYNGGSKVRGTANSGSTTTLTDTSLVGTSSMIGALVKVLGGTNKGVVRTITAHNTGTGQITFSAMYAACDNTTRYIIECNKSKSACVILGNEANFGGYDDFYNVSWYSGGYDPNFAIPISNSKSPVPLIYGQAVVTGTLIDAQMTLPSPAYEARIYGVGESAISAVVSCEVNGIIIPLTSPIFDFYDGSQSSFTFPANMQGDVQTKYYKKTSVAVIKGTYANAENSTYPHIWDSPFVTGWSPNIGLKTNQPTDVVKFIVFGLKVQKYNADGTTNGAPAWSDNPVWCLLDFVMNRCLQKTAWADINFARCHAAAAACDTLGYRLNLAIIEQMTESDIITLMLTAFRGFPTTSGGLLAFNMEQAGSVVHVFDDTTNDNIKFDSFVGPFERDVNESPNRVIVKYSDEEIRQNVALITSQRTSGTHYTSIPYSDLNGTFTAPAGTIYIGRESVAYTANSGTALTVSWTPFDTYISGYPIFQGMQTFPEMAAIYNDWDDQEEKHRVIDLEIDGRGIPTYRQAASIAEYKGKKAIDGVMQCRLTGMLDSLAVEVGDISSITHTLPGWTAEEFRIIEATESQDEEIDFLFEVYDPSFYEENNHAPGAVLSTTLPNPLAAPGQVTDIILTEGGLAGVDGTFVPNITVTYTLPAQAIFWDHAIIQIKINSGTYSTYGADRSRGLGYTIDAASGGFQYGDTVYIKVISVSAQGVSADAASAPTSSHTIAGFLTLSTPTGLALEGGGTSWNGRKFAVTWTPQGSASLDPSYISNEVEFWINGVLRATFKTKDCRWEYIFGDGSATSLDSYLIAYNGAVTIKVRRTSPVALSSSYATLALTQAAPANPANLVFVPLFRGVTFNWDRNTESDFKCYVVRTKVDSSGTFSSWAETSDNQYQRIATSAELSSFGASATIYIEVKARDIFNNDSSVSSTNASSIGLGAMDMTNVPTGYNLQINSDFDGGKDGWVSGGGGASPTIVTDNFNRSNANPIGGNWTTQSGLSALQIVSNQIEGTGAANSDNGALWNAYTFNNDQYSQVTFQSAPDTNGVGLIVRGSTSVSTFYALYVFYYNSIWQVEFGKTISGAYTNLGNIALGGTPNAGDVFKVTVVGDTISAYQNDALIGSKTDSSISSGRPGIYSGGTADIVDNWEGGDIVTGGGGDSTFDVVLASSPKSGAYAAQNQANAKVSIESLYYIPAQQDRVYALEAFAKTISGTTGLVSIAVGCYNSSKALISYPDIAANAVNPGGSFTFYQGLIGPGQTTTFPSGTVYLRTYAMLNQTSGGGNGNSMQQVQGIRLREVIESVYIKDAAITTAKIANLAVTNAQINDLSAAKITAGTILSQAITLAVTDTVGDVKIQAGKTDFGDNTAGFILGVDDSDSNKAKLEIGNATNYLKWDGAALTIRGSLNADDITAGTITSRTVQTAVSGARLVMDAGAGQFQVFNSSGTKVVSIRDGLVGSEGYTLFVLASAGVSAAMWADGGVGAGIGVVALTQSGKGVYAAATTGIAVEGVASGNGYGLQGYGLYGPLVLVTSTLSPNAPTHPAKLGTIWMTSEYRIYVRTNLGGTPQWSIINY